MSSFWVIVIILAIIGIGGHLLSESAMKDASKEAAKKFSNFTPKVKFKSSLGGNGISIDSSQKKIAVLNKYGDIESVINHDEILSIEIVKNGSSLTKTNRGSQVGGAVVGAALMGPVGLLLGGLSGTKREVAKIHQLSLRITTTNLDKPLHEIFFLKFSPPGVDVSKVEYIFKDVELWNARLTGR